MGPSNGGMPVSTSTCGSDLKNAGAAPDPELVRALQDISSAAKRFELFMGMACALVLVVVLTFHPAVPALDGGGPAHAGNPTDAHLTVVTPEAS